MVRQGHCIALVVAFLIGCAVLLMGGASGVQAQASNKEEARCEGTRTLKKPTIGFEGHGFFTTNDLSGCPKGGLLSGTDERDMLDGKDGADKVRGLGGSDQIFDGSGDDVVYGGPGNDNFFPSTGKDVIYGGPGNDMLSSNDGDGQGDELYCGAGRDRYFADSSDYVDSSCEKQLKPGAHMSGDDVAIVSTTSATSSASASSVPIPSSGGPAILLPAAALLLGSGILTYAILRRR